MADKKNGNGFLKGQPLWENLYFYQKAKSLYAITFYFANKYLKRGDRTVDQMIQAARSGKQNIVEGSEDGVTSAEMEIKLLNVARASIGELQEDYKDYLSVRHLQIWKKQHPRYDKMLDYCKFHNQPEDYEPYLEKWNDEEICNIAITLTHMVDKMMTSYQQKLENEFISQGGIRERMTVARLAHRTDQKQIIEQQERKIMELEETICQLKETIQDLQNQLNERNKEG